MYSVKRACSTMQCFVLLFVSDHTHNDIFVLITRVTVQCSMKYQCDACWNIYFVVD